MPREAPGLADENYQRLNESFYSARPDDFLSRRLGLLVLEAGRTREIQELFDSGVTVGKLSLGRAPGAPPRTDEEWDENDRLNDKFVTTDAVTLLHHVSETLLRLYLAHQSTPPCPWLEVARERHFGPFKEKVRRELVQYHRDDTFRASLQTVFYGARPSVEDVAEDEWRDGLDNLGRWMRYFARWFLDDAEIYNAAKHGLAVQAGEVSFHIAPTGSDQAVMSTVGDAITFLRLDETGHWRLATRRVNLDELLVATWVATLLLNNLWLVARWRYLGDKPGQLPFIMAPLWREFIDATHRGGATRFEVQLTYYVLSDPDG